MARYILQEYYEHVQNMNIKLPVLIFCTHFAMIMW